MPTDLTGTPTSLGIGTYNVDADAPSGLGFNEAMAQIDALIAARGTNPSVTGVVVWNGSAWVSPSGTPDGTKFLRDDNSWATPSAGVTWTHSATPPASPADGDIWVYPADDTNGVEWMFRYDSAETTYKWRFLGGAPLLSEVATLESTSSTSYADLTTVGPSITLPRSGDYKVAFWASTSNSSANGGEHIAPKFGAAAASDIDQAETTHPGTGTGADVMQLYRKITKTGLTASDVVKLQYKVGSGTGQFQRRGLEILPVRVV